MEDFEISNFSIDSLSIIMTSLQHYLSYIESKGSSCYTDSIKRSLEYCIFECNAKLTRYRFLQQELISKVEKYENMKDEE